LRYAELHLQPHGKSLLHRDVYRLMMRIEQSSNRATTTSSLRPLRVFENVFILFPFSPSHTFLRRRHRLHSHCITSTIATDLHYQRYACSFETGVSSAPSARCIISVSLSGCIVRRLLVAFLQSTRFAQRQLPFQSHATLFYGHPLGSVLLLISIPLSFASYSALLSSIQTVSPCLS